MEQIKRSVGNRRTEEELEKLELEQNKLTFRLIEQPNFKGSKELLEKMQTFERAYIDGNPKLSDEEWDLMKNKYNYKESITSIAPSGREYIKMLAPLPSIDKAGNLEELNYFLNKFKENQIFKIEIKADGLTANVRYKLSKDKKIYNLDCITSRGNGRYGLKIWTYALSGVKKNWTDKIESKYVMDILECDQNELPEYFELRGEAVIPKNKHTYEKYGKDAVWRSVAAGIFNRKVPYNLNGLLEYISGMYNLSINNNGYLELKPEIKGRRCLNPDVLESAKLVASLFENKDPDKYTKYDTIIIYNSGLVEIKHENGNVWSGYDDGEELDILFYSVAINGGNIDTSKIGDIPGIKYISNIQFEENEKENLEKLSIPLTYRETSNKNDILQSIFDFYGTDKNGKRDLNKHRLRNLYEYALDGIVIKPIDSNKETQGLDFRNHKNNANKILQPKYPEDQIAVKLLSEIVKVKLVKIEYKETELGNITCSGILDKPYLTESGAWVERINLHNLEWLQQNSWIKEGCEYEMVLSMDIIPVLLNPNL